MPLHRDKADYVSIQAILESPTPVNSVSRTNSIASSVQTLVPYEPIISATLSTNISNLRRRQEEIQSCITSLIDPVRSAGHRIETWPRVSGNPTRALSYQEAIRLIRSSLDCPTRGHGSMEGQEHATGSQKCGSERRGSPGIGEIHPPLAIRQRTFPTKDETTSTQTVSRDLAAKKISSQFFSSLSLNGANLSSQNGTPENNPPRNAPAVLHRRRAIANIRSANTLEERVAAAYEHAKPRQNCAMISGKDGFLTLSHTGHDDHPGTHWKDAENTVKPHEDTSTFDSNRAKNTPCDFSPSTFTKTLPYYYTSQTTDDNEDSGYRPRLGGIPPKNARHPLCTGQRARQAKCLAMDVNVDMSLPHGNTEKFDVSSNYPQRREEHVAAAEETVQSVQNDFVKRDRPGTKRGSCHEL